MWSTAKDVLEKLRPLHALPGVILEWRCLTAALSRVVFPLQRGTTYSRTLAMHRMHSVVDTFTATGRVTMHEPNLQNVPKDFAIEIPRKKPAAFMSNFDVIIPLLVRFFFSLYRSFYTFHTLLCIIAEQFCE